MEASNYNKMPLLEKNHGPWPYTYGWTIQDVSDFIRDIGYPQYVKCFTNNAVNGQQLACLDVYDMQRFGINRMEHAIRIIAYIRKAVKSKLYDYETPNQPPRQSYLPAERCSRACPIPCHLPPVNKPLIIEMAFEDYCLPKRDQGGQYNRCHIPVASHFRQCSITPLKNSNRNPWARKPIFLPCYLDC